jgi:hypothetical protein
MIYQPHSSSFGKPDNMREEYKYQISLYVIFPSVLFSVSLSDPKYWVLRALMANTLSLCMFCPFPF